MELCIDSEVDKVFRSYPEPLRPKLYYLRTLILETAEETPAVTLLEETLKWGQPSYLTKTGSTIRLGHRESDSPSYAIYFHCKTKLVDTFKELYSNQFVFEGNRAIIFELATEIPVCELKHCISLSLTYHQRKHRPLLGG